MSKNNYWAFLLLIIAAAPMLGSTSGNKYDSAWWRSTPQDERTQFIAGYLDCAVYDLGETKLAKAQWNVIEPEITTYFASQHGSTPQTVLSLIRSLGLNNHSTDRAAELHTEKHGIFDGDYWRQISPSARLGFVEGYTACRSSKPNQKQFTAHSSAWYVDQINHTYGITPDDDIEDRLASKKIATIIQEHTK